MKRVTMRNGEVVDAETAEERLPWCPECESYSVPEDGVCMTCGATIEYLDAGPEDA